MKRKKPETNEYLKSAFLEIVDNQLKANDPPEVRETLTRLTASGISDQAARMYIATAVTVEVVGVMKDHTPFNLERYVLNLKNLPDEPKE